MVKIGYYAKMFSEADSVIVFDVANVNLKKYGNAIHRDEDVVYFWFANLGLNIFVVYTENIDIQ